ncbi:hypothetical protein BDN67DRAFT_982813 [Paxillus ammoniavirescens]|nr:hypothetical protein BDN67DRAFT_982813 [Paxillus ammoniavirescens]
MTTVHDTPPDISLGDVPVKVDDVPSLQGQYYKLTPEQAEFLKQQTGITDDDELKQHIFAVQAEAYKVAPYPCIMGFLFILWLPAYEDVKKIGLTRKGAILLDIGCCVGTDIRKAVADGFPAERTIGSDLHPGLLSPEPGSIICGGNWGLPEKGLVMESFFGSFMEVFCHSPQTWTEMWDGVVFPKGSVKVDTFLVEPDMQGYKTWYLLWSVKRL